ncbi:MAG: adenosylcobinamide-phosphate synthase CbiB [Burkholderiaceae bacterium]
MIELVEAAELGWVFASALLIAFVIDHFFGEPPARLHPVVWMGNALNWAAVHILPKPATDDNVPDYPSFLAGAVVWIALIAIILIVTYSLQLAVLQLPAVWAALLLGSLLKPLFAWRMLRREVQAVETALQQSLEAGRARLSMLVSRDITALTEAQVRESAIETLAENLNDSVIAPIFWFVLFGLPGAAVYRFANTADAMWGYKGIRIVNGKGRNWEWAGKWAARADDVLSWLPARITAALLWLVSGSSSGFMVSGFWTRLQQEAAKTPSPNSGWPMATMALILNIQLSKPDVYTLNAPGNAPNASDIQKSVKLASNSTIAGVFIAYIAILYVAFWRVP